MILPGATIGILGGGQLGRMTGMAARSMGYDVLALDPDPACPASAVASEIVAARFEDVDRIVELARRCNVVTLEIEQISAAGLAAAANVTPVRPSAAALAIVQDRAVQKKWLRSHGFPVGPYRIASAEGELADAVVALGASVAKSTTGGYDGRAQFRLAHQEQVGEAWRALGARRCVVERFLDVAFELSVLVARRPSGDMVSFPASLNDHANGVLDWSMFPAAVSPTLGTQASELARGIAEAIGIEGLLAVEMFVTRDGTLLVNELAPRPHNTYHATERSCQTSQFEQLVRAVCDLPLGSVEVTQPGAIANLLGDLWTDGEPNFPAALAVPGIRLHLYGKTVARPGRKMGHLSALAATGEHARENVLSARSRLTQR